MSELVRKIFFPLILGFVFGSFLGSCSKSDKENSRTSETKKAAGYATETKRMDEKTGTLEDAWLHAQIVAKLITNPGTPQRKINVDVVDKVVTLRGRVESPEQKHEAEIVAQETAGVKQVNNKLKVVKQTAGAPSGSRSLIGMILAAAAGRK